MNRVRRETDVELGLSDIKPGDRSGDASVGKVIEEENRAGVTGGTSQKPPSSGEFLNAEGGRGGNAAAAGNMAANKTPDRHPPLAEPEPTDELSEPPTPLPARLPHNPHPLSFADTGHATDAKNSVNADDNAHGRDHDRVHDHDDEADDLLKSTGAGGGYDELDMGGGHVNGGLHDPFTIERPGSPALTTYAATIPDVNTYQQKKNLAQGMMDLALLSANANQLRYVLESSTGHPYYYPSIVLISFSIIFQVLVGIGLILNSRYNVKDESDICKADKINNMTVLGVFLITLVNVFITSFSVGAPTSDTITAARTT